MFQRDIKHVADHWEVNHQGRHRMNASEKLHEIALEHPDRFVLAGDVTLRHAFKLPQFRDGINGAKRAVSWRERVCPTGY